MSSVNEENSMLLEPKRKCGRLWEFLRDLLLNPEYCPSIICWEDYEEGEFKFVDCEKVVQLWGSARGIETMDWAKLDRVMRYYHSTHVLTPVVKGHVYRFAVNATGWQTDNPNFLKSNHS